jgi:predicted GTPase
MTSGNEGNRLQERRRTVICGAAGRDFHNFNVVFREDPTVEVVAFTATQIPGIDDRTYPPPLAGDLYPDGIPIVGEDSLETVCRKAQVDEVVFAYSDVDNAHVMRLAARALACGADFSLLGPRATMLAADVPVISICAVRTGCGKSQIARFLSTHLASRGLRPAAIRHPMPYGVLTRQIVQRFATIEDLDDADCTLEEREEYEPHIAAGGVVFAGVDYRAILHKAEQEADVIIWDGGNNDFSFIRPDFSIAVVDALRPEQLDTHYPGAAVLKMADLVVVNKIHAATDAQRDRVTAELDRLAPDKPRVFAASPVTLDDAEMLAGARVLVVEDGPTITHGGMPHGAGYHAVADVDVAEIVEPREFATAEIREVFDRFDHIGPVLPAMGYGPSELAALRATIEAAQVDVVVAGTPIDLARALDVSIPVVRAHYRYQDTAEPGLLHYVDEFLAERHA